MPACGFIKASGEGCKALPMRGEGWCYVHHPHYKERRQRDGSKGGKRGGRGRPGADVADLKQDVRTVIDHVLEGKVLQGPGAVALQGYNVLLRASKLELEIREQTEVIERMEALEEALEHKNKGGGGRWGSRIG